MDARTLTAFKQLLRRQQLPHLKAMLTSSQVRKLELDAMIEALVSEIDERRPH